MRWEVRFTQKKNRCSKKSLTRKWLMAQRILFRHIKLVWKTLYNTCVHKFFSKRAYMKGCIDISITTNSDFFRSKWVADVFLHITVVLTFYDVVSLDNWFNHNSIARRKSRVTDHIGHLIIISCDCDFCHDISTTLYPKHLEV